MTQPYKYLFQSPKMAREYKALLDSMNTEWLVKCYKEPTVYMRDCHMGMLEAVLEDRGVNLNGIR